MIQIHTNCDSANSLRHEYTMIGDKNDLALLYSDVNWIPQLHHKLAAKLIDDGNGLHITLGDDTVELSYSEAFRLFLLFREKYRDEVKIKEMVLTERI
jgi:hypothetical protein